MNDVLKNILEHPFASTIIIGAVLGGIADIIRAGKGYGRYPEMHIKLEK